MQIYEYEAKKRFSSGSVIAIGFFDGVHIAHRCLIEKARAEATARSVPLGVFTFSSESGIKPGAKRIYTTAQRLEILSLLGVDFAVVAEFGAIVDITKEDFVKEVLVDQCGARTIVAGYNFRFGKGAMGDVSSLVSLANSSGSEAIIVPKLEYDKESVSSTAIRELLEGGKPDIAAELLGAPYFIDGVVERGLGIGAKKLGFATVNLPASSNAVSLKRGVYRTLVQLSSGVYSGVANVGVCPTFENREEHTEIHIIDFLGDLYGEKIRVYFLGYLRPEMKFENPKELIMQIDVDKKRTINENRGTKWIINGQSFQ